MRAGRATTRRTHDARARLLAGCSCCWLQQLLAAGWLHKYKYGVRYLARIPTSTILQFLHYISYMKSLPRAIQATVLFPSIFAGILHLCSTFLGMCIFSQFSEFRIFRIQKSSIFAVCVFSVNFQNSEFSEFRICIPPISNICVFSVSFQKYLLKIGISEISARESSDGS